MKCQWESQHRYTRAASRGLVLGGMLELWEGEDEDLLLEVAKALW